MPELPEVETVRRGLAKKIENKKPVIERIQFLRKDLRDPMPIKKLKTLEGATLLSIDRRAKYLLFNTDRGVMISHLGMTGTWRVASRGEERDHDHIYIYFSNGERWAYRDPRRFGIFDFAALKTLHPRLSALGVEPLEEAFTSEHLLHLLRGKSTSIKVAIMDQKILVGVGNIYASEALFMAGIKPERKALRLKIEDCQRLVSSIKQVLEKAILAGGSSISDFKTFHGTSGDFQNEFQVYDRKNLGCVICATKVKAKVIGGRSTFWCPKCQPK